jgi:RNA polymerase sigma-70 factor, ECF subfamily
MSRSREFDRWWPLLLSTAHSILDDADDAGPVMHRTWLCYESALDEPASAREFLLTTVTRFASEALHEGRTRLENDLENHEEGAQAPVTAALSLLERLTPLQRAVFVLLKILGCGPARTAAAVGCSVVMCHRITTDLSGTSGTDGQLPLWPHRIVGADHVARALAAILPALTGVGITVEPHQVGHHHGAVFRDPDGQALGALSLDILDGQVRTIRWVKVPNQAAADTPTPA